MRGIPIVAICHSGIAPGQLRVPFAEFEAVSASEVGDLLKLYSRIASELGAEVAESRLEKLASDTKEFEKDYEERRASKCL